jgi:hypothetical protein
MKYDKGKEKRKFPKTGSIKKGINSEKAQNG